MAINSDKPVQGYVDPHLLAAMQALDSEDEIDLLEYWRIIWKKRMSIASAVLIAMVVAAGISLRMPNIYHAEALLAPVSDDMKSGGLSSALGGLGGLASLAGVSLPSGGNVEENLAVLKSREFLWSFFKDEKLMPVLFVKEWDGVKKQWLNASPDDHPSLWDAYRLYIDEGVLSVSTDKTSGLVHIGIDWDDADVAAKWSNLLVARLNNYLRQKAIDQSSSTLQYLNDELRSTQVEDQRKALFALISQEQKKAMLANTRKQFAFNVIDKAVAPDKKAKPKRAIIVILTGFVVGFLTIIGVFVREGIKQRNNADGEK